jgi:hypothetical protein
MKTKIILYSIIAFLGLALVFAFKSSNTINNKKYCFVKVYELQSQLEIFIYKDGEVTVENIKWDRKTGGTTGFLKSEWDIFINKIINDGFSLKSSTAVTTANSSAVHSITTTYEYIFEKE